ncbi:hypothetical protein FHS72_001196 [Loktanella ponticola]|uniref:DUF3617 family protein n=1 Tax=Yoonia ponticola TaxID=1524255 RepID=A0A7W9EXF5_9RHOB|nr:DUF3617 family protein [Yoonia ponticola]MBB5721584.1 hypothetical protein [Yoonia ponticola]
MKIVNHYFTAVILLLSASQAAADRVIQVEAGLWEYTHSLEIPGLLAPMANPKTECISATEARRNLSDLLGELSRDAGCTVTNLKDNLNTVKFDLTCDPHLDRVTVGARGNLAFRYGRTAITGSATGVISVGGVEVDVNATAQARRVGRCDG